MYFKTIIKKIHVDEQKNIFILFAYSIASFIVAFPISDQIHFLIGSTSTIIAMLYIIWLKLKDKKTTDKIKTIGKICSEYIIIFSTIFSLCLIVSYFIDYKNFSNKKHYKYISSNMENNIEQIDNYILEQNELGKKVYILDATACVYMIPIDKYNKNYDLFLKGNLGAEGEKGQIENLEKEENIVVLIMNDNNKRNWQNPEQVRKYIKDNWVKKGEIEQFYIYEKE